MNTDMRRDSYGYMRMGDSDSLMAIYLASGKKQIEYWGENIKHSKEPMAYHTFKARVRDYCARTNQFLSATQIERTRVPPAEFKRLAQLYLQVSAALLPAGSRMNKAEFYDVYVIVQPYDKVPSFEQFREKLKLILTDNSRRETGSASYEASYNNTASLGQQLETTGGINANLRPTTDSNNNQCSLAVGNDFVKTAARMNADLEPTTDSEDDHCSLVAGNHSVETTARMDADWEQTTDSENDHCSFVADNNCDDSIRVVVPLFELIAKINPADARVATFYRCVQKLTGTLGGNGSGGSIYGEITKGSMQHIIDFLITHADLNKSSKFIDIGSGQGKPNIHVAQNPGVQLSIGIESEIIRFEVDPIYISYYKYIILLKVTLLDCNLLY